MHSFLAYTSMELSAEKRTALASALTKAGEEVFHRDFTLTFHFIPEKYSSPHARQLLHFIAHVPEDITLDERRDISRAMQDATIRTLGCENNERATILFWKAKPNEIAVPQKKGKGGEGAWQVST